MSPTETAGAMTLTRPWWGHLLETAPWSSNTGTVVVLDVYQSQAGGSACGPWIGAPGWKGLDTHLPRPLLPEIGSQVGLGHCGPSRLPPPLPCAARENPLPTPMMLPPGEQGHVLWFPLKSFVELLTGHWPRPILGSPVGVTPFYPHFSEGAACGQSWKDRARTLADVKLILQTVGFPWHTVALEEVGGPVSEGGPPGCPRGARAYLMSSAAGLPLGLFAPGIWVEGGPGSYVLSLPWKVFALPPSVLRCSAQEPVGTMGNYKVAVDSFLQQEHMLGAEGVGGSPNSTQGEEQLGQPCTQDPQDPAGPPPADQTEALSRLFDSVKTLTAKEELLQTLR